MAEDKEGKLLDLWTEWLSFGHETLDFFPNPNGEFLGWRNNQHYSPNRLLVRDLSELLKLKKGMKRPVFPPI